MRRRTFFVAGIWLLLLGVLGAEPSKEAAQAKQPAADPFLLRVLVLNYDPIYQGKPLHQALGFNDPRELVEGYVADMQRASGGMIRYEIAQWRDIDGFYARTDGGIYEVDQYVKMRRSGNGWPKEIVADYPRLLREQGAIPLIDDGSIDEVWVFGDHYFGLWEASMAGPGAFFVNGGVYPEVPSARPFVLYGFNYERGVAEMLHNTSHRVEATMNRIYGQWNLERPANNWELFSANVEQSNGVAGVGTCHWPANAQHDYDYGNRREVESHADDFLNYPHLTGEKKKVSALTWSPDGKDPHRGYMNWYFERIPRAAGINPDGKRNNWWNYIVDFQNYDPQGQPMPPRAMVVKWRKSEDSIAVMVAFQSSGGVDPADISAEDAHLSVSGSKIAATQVHLPRKDRGGYRVASFVFPLEAAMTLESADFHLAAGAAGLAPLSAATWRLTPRGENSFAIPLDDVADPARAAAKWVLEQGGKVGVQGNGEWLSDPAMLGQTAGGEIVRVSLSRSEVDPDRLSSRELQRLLLFESLEELNLSGQMVGDDACQWIGELRELRVLNLHGTKISDEGMLLFERLEKLQRLDVGYLHQRLTDRGARVLLKTPQLRWLNIYASSITDATAEEVLAGLEELEHVELTSTAVSPQAIERLKTQLPEVQVVKHR